jgi:hypothetical protein
MTVFERHRLEAGPFEDGPIRVAGQRTRDTFGPCAQVSAYVFWEFGVCDDVRDRQATARSQQPIDLPEHGGLVDSEVHYAV